MSNTHRPTKPKISVVMSAYNAADYLHEAIGSILAQTFSEFEFIIVDDGSTDKTPEIIEKFRLLDPRIIVISQRYNKGLITALNMGFRITKGKYIARMDADDISLPERLSKEFAYMESHPDAVIVGTQAAYIDENGRITGIEPFLLDDTEIRTEILMRNSQFRHGAVLIRRTVSNEGREFYDKAAVHYEDFEYWPRLLQHGRGANLPDVLYLYRQSPTSLTVTKKDEMRAGSDYVMHREFAKLELPYFGTKQMVSAFRKAVKYKPSTVSVNGKKFRTNLRWWYQSYLFGLSGLYAKKHKFISAVLVMAVSFVLNPARYTYTVISVIARRIYRA